MVLKKFIDEATGAWRNVSYGLNREDSFESGSPREYILKQLELETHDGDKFDIENIVVDFSYHESIESAFLRCDISIVDAVNFYQRLQGGEKIYINIVTATALDKEPLQTIMQVYKIGSVIKAERGQMYILHCVSPEMYHDEMNKVFKAFGPYASGDAGKGGDDGKTKTKVKIVPKVICEKYLKCKGNSRKVKEANFEPHSPYNFIACNWKPSDTIAYLSDRVTRETESKGSNKQSGFLFWENRNGFNFRSIDGIAQGHASQGNIYTYSYTMKGNEGVDGRYAIENVAYPDKSNHLSNMRMGTYKNSAIGISMGAPKNSYAPDSGKKEEADASESVNSETATATSGTGINPAPGGTISEPRVLTFNSVFGKANKVTAAKGGKAAPPIVIPDFFDIDKSKPTRMKIRALPGLIHQPDKANPNNGTNPDVDIMAVAQYASARYNLLKTIKLNITVPGNSELTAGSLIKVLIPASLQDGDNVQLDQQFSGLYVIAGLTHIWRRTGLTTKLFLVRDSKPWSSKKKTA
tara:strand:- start:746 stop:2314 length:1569 start_codon:yes stop_codon:yes gene_type:complete